MNRRNRTLIVVGVAVLLASLASFGVYRAIQRIPVREVEVATRYMVVANPGKEAMLPIGTIVAREQVALVPWPAASPVPGGFSSVDEVIGRGLIASVLPNEPITESKLAPREAGGGLPPTIPAGMRAMAVRVNDVIGVAGFALPGTRVDVIVTVTPEQQNAQTQSRVVLNNIQVLTAGTNYDQERSREGQAMPSRVVTLLVTPSDAERLALAQSEGEIVLALRNPLDTEEAETNGARLAALLGAPAAPPVRAVVQGRPRMVQPPPPPPPPKPYTVESIRGARRAEETLK
jgi:pilus assembly protein CpaB